MTYKKGLAPLIIVLIVALGLAAGTTAGYALREPIKKAIKGQTTAEEIKEAVDNIKKGQSKFELEGVATGIDATNSIITVKIKSSTNSIKELRLTEAPISVTDSTIIKFNDQKALKITDIPIDSKVHIGGTIADGKLTATRIEVQKEDGVSNKENEFKIGGTVKEVWTDKLIVTVKTANSDLKEEKGKDITILVVVGTKIEKEDTVIALTDIKVGDEVKIEGYKADQYTANEIEVKVKEEAGELEEEENNEGTDKNIQNENKNSDADKDKSNETKED